MRENLILFMVFSAFVVTMCGTTPAMELANPIDGLSCQTSAGRAVECYYICPEGMVGPILFDGDPSLSLSKGDFDHWYCDTVTQSTSTAPPANPSPSPSPTSPPTEEATATIVVPVTAQDPLLAETVSMCDLGGKLINYRLLEPSTELAVETLDVKIAGQDSTCYVNPTNPSLLTCTIPNAISFPAQVVVRMNGAVVNDFLYSGVGCSILTTPTSRPRSYP